MREQFANCEIFYRCKEGNMIIMKCEKKKEGDIKETASARISSEELTHWKSPWYWEGLRTGGEGDDRGWDGWMASPTQWVWV